ncbi:MAG: hypothetical protein SGJ01_16510 [Gemmatimonadota bacterium]|nr:hypothetical protein [Gemmatimonadota bacterium]
MSRSAWLLTLAVLACGGESPWSPALAWPDCAPFDGAATRIVIPQEAGSDSASQTNLTLVIYQAPEEIRGREWAIPDQSGTELSVLLCPATGPCISATAGWVRVDSGAPGSEIHGQYRVTFSDGRVLAGRYAAPLQPPIALCG